MELCFDTAFSVQEIPVYSFLYWAGVIPVFFRNTWVKWLWSQKCRSAAICCNSMVPETRSCLGVHALIGQILHDGLAYQFFKKAAEKILAQPGMLRNFGCSARLAVEAGTAHFYKGKATAL